MNKKWICTVCGYVHEGDNPPDECPICGAPKAQFVLDEKLPESLEKLAKEAFAGESKAHVRNLAFARQAEKDGYPQIALLFRVVSEAERVHADSYLKYLEGEIRSTEENLQTAFENEIKANSQIYPPMIKDAIDAGREDLAGSFSRAKDVEERHSQLYKDAMSALTTDRGLAYHVCEVCGYVFDGDLPEQCPVCRAKRNKFKEIS